MVSWHQMSLVSLAKGGHLGEGAAGLARIILQLQSYATSSSQCKPDLTEKGELGVGTGDLASLVRVPSRQL